MPVPETFALHPGEGVPTFISAGILKTPSAVEPFLEVEDRLTIPALTLGSFTVNEHAGNKGDSNLVDHVYYADREMFGNALGLPNPGIEGMRRLKPIISECNARGIRTIISVTNLPQETGVETIPDLAEAAAELEPTAIEVNISCPNGKNEKDGTLHAPICNDEDVSEELMSAVRSRIGAYVVTGIKDAPHTTSVHEPVDGLAVRSLMTRLNPYVDFVTGINTIGNQEFTEITAANGRGGMSGLAVREVAWDWLMNARAALSEETAILSVGGVESRSVSVEVTLRLGLGALLVGGAQQFYRSASVVRLSQEWARQV